MLGFCIVNIVFISLVPPRPEVRMRDEEKLLFNQKFAAVLPAITDLDGAMERYGALNQQLSMDDIHRIMAIVNRDSLFPRHLI